MASKTFQITHTAKPGDKKGPPKKQEAKKEVVKEEKTKDVLKETEELLAKQKSG